MAQQRIPRIIGPSSEPLGCRAQAIPRTKFRDRASAVFPALSAAAFSVASPALRRSRPAPEIVVASH